MAATTPTVMVVEDSEDIRLMLKMLLQRKGYHVLEAADGRQAIDRAPRESPARYCPR